MGFEKTAAKTRKELHPELPKAADAEKEHPDGIVYRTEDGKRFRLRHAVAAHWAPIREPKAPK
jgi:hypothetical protein